MYGDSSAYGVRDGKLVFISEVQRGLACGCVCAHCGQSLLARKGAVRRPHFAHHEPTGCDGGSETVLHLLAKELFTELTTLTIPPYRFARHRETRGGIVVRHEALVANGGMIPIHAVHIELPEDGFRPDVLVESNHKLLLIEIAVFNKVQRIKLRKLRRRNLPAIEIRLAPEDAFLSREQLKQKLHQDLPSKSWLFHPAQREAERAFFAKLRGVRRSTLAAISIASPSRWKGRRNVQFAPRNAGFLSRAECDKRTDAFFRKYGRYPSLEECGWLWSSGNAPEP